MQIKMTGTYKIFKKSSICFKFLTPVLETNTMRVAKILSDELDVIIGNDEETGELFLELNQCPRIYVGMDLRCKNIKTGQKDDIGVLKDIQYKHEGKYLLIF